MNRTAPNPYRRNAEILRGFFKKPLTLITGLIFAVSFITDAAVLIFRISTGDSGSFIMFPAFSLWFALIFLLLFNEARSKSQRVTFKLQTVLLKIISVIICCICIAGIAFLLVLSALYLSFDSANPFSADNLYVLAAVILPAVLMFAIPMIFCINLFKTAASFRKSVNSVYLCRKGALGAGVFGILSAAATFLPKLVAPYFIDSVIDLLHSNPVTSSDFVFGFFLLTASTYFGAAATFPLGAYDYAAAILSSASMLSVSAFALSYNSRIKKITEGFAEKLPNKPSKPEQPKQSKSVESPYNNGEAHKAVPIKPQEFIPEPVFKAAEKKICPHCKYESDGKMPFCANCGTKL